MESPRGHGPDRRWIPFSAAEVLALPPDLQAGWPDAQRPTAVSCALSARPGAGQGPSSTGPLSTGPSDPEPAPSELSAGPTAAWVARASLILGGAPVVGGFELLGPGLRIVVSAGVLHRACCVVWRWTDARGQSTHPGGGCLLGRVDRAARLPELIAELVPRETPAAVLGVLGPRGAEPEPWTIGRSASPPGRGGAGPEAGTAAPVLGAHLLAAQVRARVRADLHRAVLAAAGETRGSTTGGPVGEPGVGDSRRGGRCGAGRR
ncbi:hypothetical protein NLM24_46360 [Nocardia zapadnayensis]|uniref:hypothetical protein n=1 Tax=Brevibacterium sp. R8603A2 TaxID=2929779 RepID=UPI001FF708E5|nr:MULTISPECIES: hypothetical protein [Actinomycetes]MCK1802232.1 hypothetical protein [Brevibacterium sp. R8603A2]MCX0277861.1 hypothetical protein [Nocardia zapadnayensis]